MFLRIDGWSTGDEIAPAAMQSIEPVLGDGKFEHLPLRKSEKNTPKDPPEQAVGNGDRRMPDIGNP